MLVKRHACYTPKKSAKVFLCVYKKNKTDPKCDGCSHQDKEDKCKQ